MMKALYIRTFSQQFNKDATLLCKKTPGCMDLAFRNTGTSICTIQSEGGVTETISPGDPLLTWGGYPGYYRDDVIKISFVGGTGKLQVDMTVNTNFNECYK